MSAVSLVEPGAVETELIDHLRRRSGSSCAAASVTSGCRRGDIADAIAYIVTRARHVAINEVLIRPTEQVR